MKSILLNTAVLTNGGTRADAGSTLLVGSGKDAVTADRARELVTRRMAVSNDPAPAAKDVQK